MPALLRLQILAYTPTAFFQCRGCEIVMEETGFGRSVREEQIGSGLPPEMQREYAGISDRVERLVAAGGGRVAVELIDVASLRGFWKSLRHGIRRYPAFIVGGRVTADLAAAEAEIARRLSATRA